MIRPPSIQKPYDEFWSEDEAFEQRPADPPDNASAEAKAAHAAELAAYEAKLTAAVEHGHWHALRVAGGTEPTKFLVRPLPSDATGILFDMRDAGVGLNELFITTFRVALLSVSNLDGAKVVPVEDDRFGKIASLAWMEQAGIVGTQGMRIILEIGARLLRRASPLDPKR